MKNGNNNGIISAIEELLPAAPFPVLEFVYWYLVG